MLEPADLPAVAVTQKPAISRRSARILQVHARHIQRLGRRAIADVVEIGRRLQDAKRQVGHGKFLCWIAAEFGWSEDTAQRFIRVHDLISKNRNLRNLKVPLSAFYLLSQPSVPNRALVEVARRVGAGKGLSVNTVKEIIVNTRRWSPLGYMCRLARQILCEVQKAQLSDVPQVVDRHCVEQLLGERDQLHYILRNMCGERLATYRVQIDKLQREIEKLEALEVVLRQRSALPRTDPAPAGRPDACDS